MTREGPIFFPKEATIIKLNQFTEHISNMDDYIFGQLYTNNLQFFKLIESINHDLTVNLKKILEYNIDISGGMELDVLAESVKLSRFFMDGEEKKLLSDKDFRELIKDEYMRLGRI